jgi:hypothetical protein
MTAFTTKNLTVEGPRNEQWVYYRTAEGARRVVARCKKGLKGGTGAADLARFIRKNFTVEEWFSLRETLAPLEIAKTKGYILPHVRKWLREAGLPETMEGQRELRRRQWERYEKA